LVGGPANVVETFVDVAVGQQWMDVVHGSIPSWISGVTGKSCAAAQEVRA
jgi:hypothetical protein